MVTGVPTSDYKKRSMGRWRYTLEERASLGSSIFQREVFCWKSLSQREDTEIERVKDNESGGTLLLPKSQLQGGQVSSMELRRVCTEASEEEFDLASQRVNSFAGGWENSKKGPTSHSQRLSWEDSLISCSFQAECTRTYVGVM